MGKTNYKVQAYSYNDQPKIVVSTNTSRTFNEKSLEARYIKRVRVTGLDGEFSLSFPNGVFRTPNYYKRIVTLPICYENFFVLSNKETSRVADAKSVNYSYTAITYKGLVLDMIDEKWTGDEKDVEKYNRLAPFARGDRELVD